LQVPTTAPNGKKRRQQNPAAGKETEMTALKDRIGTHKGSEPASAEQRLKELGIDLPAPPEPFGTYMEAVQTGNLLLLSGMLPTEGRGAKFVDRIGAELGVEAERNAAHLAPLTHWLSRGSMWDRLTNCRRRPRVAAYGSVEPKCPHLTLGNL
jgi:hypothetical protein